MSIVHIPDDIKQEFKINSDGSITASIRGAARIVDVSAETLSKHFRKTGVNLKPSKLAVKLLNFGFEAVNLNFFAQSGIPDTALFLILEYYAYEAGRYRTEQALSVCRVFGTIGLRTWIKNELGIVSTSQQKAPTLDSLTLDDLELLHLHAEFDDASDPETMLEGIDRVFWNMPKQVIEHLIAVRKYDRLMRCLPSQLKLYRLIRLETYCDIPKKEAKNLIIENRDLNVAHILKKHAENDRASATNDISEYRELATDRALIRAASNFEQQIEKRLQSSPQKNLKAVE